MNNTAAQKPVHVIRIGRIAATIWANKTEKATFHNVTFSRTYTADGKPASSDSFGRNDLLAVAKIADQAHSWIVAQR